MAEFKARRGAKDERPNAAFVAYVLGFVGYKAHVLRDYYTCVLPNAKITPVDVKVLFLQGLGCVWYVAGEGGAVRAMTSMEVDDVLVELALDEAMRGSRLVNCLLPSAQ